MSERVSAVYDWLQLWLLDICLLAIVGLICLSLILNPQTAQTETVLYRAPESHVMGDSTDEFYIHDAQLQ